MDETERKISKEKVEFVNKIENQKEIPEIIAINSKDISESDKVVKRKSIPEDMKLKSSDSIESIDSNPPEEDKPSNPFEGLPEDSIDI